MHVIGKHHPSVDLEGHQNTRSADGRAEQPNMRDKYTGASIAQIDSEKITAPINTVSPVLWHETDQASDTTTERTMHWMVAACKLVH